MNREEEIIESFLFNDIEGMPPMITEGRCLEAMRELARERAIGFANFVGNRPLPEYSESTNKWRWWDNSKRDYDYATTEDLYSKYEEHLKKIIMEQAFGNSIGQKLNSSNADD